MKIKTNELTGPALRWAVASCRLPDAVDGHFSTEYISAVFSQRPWALVDKYHPDTDWSQGGPIIERELLDVCPYDPNGKGWRCTKRDPDYTKAPDRCHSAEWGPTPLVAAMRCFVASKLGDEVDVPNELLTKSDIIRALHPDAAELKITPADPADFTGFPTLKP